MGGLVSPSRLGRLGARPLRITGASERLAKLITVYGGEALGPNDRAVRTAYREGESVPELPRRQGWVRISGRRLGVYRPLVPDMVSGCNEPTRFAKCDLPDPKNPKTHTPSRCGLPPAGRAASTRPRTAADGSPVRYSASFSYAMRGT